MVILLLGVLVSVELTAYNTVAAQTDSTPCLAASNVNICGRKDAAACPRRWFKRTFIFQGRRYHCFDKLAKKNDERIDISFDKDLPGAKQFGRRTGKILLE